MTNDSGMGADTRLPGPTVVTSRAPAVAGTGDVTVCIIEDQRAIAELLSEFLTGEGYDTVRIEPPYRTKRITEAGASIVLLDIVLGRASGWDVLDAIRTDPATRDLPTIITSAMYDRPGLHTLPSGGPIVFMPKPFDLADLIDTIRRLTLPIPDTKPEQPDHD